MNKSKEKETITITHSEFENLIKTELKTVKFVGLSTITTQNSLNKGRGENAMVEAIKVDPGNIKKHTKMVGVLSGGSCTYQDFVQGRLLKEAKAKGKDEAQLTFKAGPRKWGEHIDECPALIGHKGSRYLVLFCVANTKPIVEHTYEDKAIDLTEARFDAYRKPPRKEGGNQGTENAIIVRDYKFDSIKQINMLDKHYKLVPDPA